MELTLDEQNLIAEFRKLPPAARDELKAHITALARHAATDAASAADSEENQCRLKSREPRPEAEKTPIFTE